MITTTIIIPCFDRRTDLQRCLTSIRAQADRRIEVIVIDDHSHEPLEDLCNSGEICIRNEINLGPSYSRNLAATRARGRNLLFLDSDVELLPGGLRAIEEILASDRRVGCVGGCGPANHDGDDVTFVKTKYYESSGRNLSIVRTADAFVESDIIECDHFESANLAMRREVFHELGGFDPYWFYMGEDREICLRLRRAGYRVVVSWRARAIHHERESAHKRGAPFRRFLARRFLEVAFKLDGYRGAARWLRTNRDQLDLLRPLQPGKALAKIRQLNQRRAMRYLEPHQMHAYVEYALAQIRQ